MKNLKNLFIPLCAVLLIFTTSCDKTEESTPVTLLTKITQSENGTEYVRTFEYDSQNRFVKLKESFDTTIIEGMVTYNTDGEMSQILTLENGVEISKDVYTYTATTITGIEWDKNEDDVWVEGIYKDIYDLNSDGLITKYQSFYNLDSEWVSYSYQLLIWTNGNLEKSEMWNVEGRKTSAIKRFSILNEIGMMSSGLKSANDTKLYVATYEYDDKINAYSGMGYAFGIDALYKNNVTKVTYSFENQENIITNLNYEYNDKNYPVKRTFSYTNPDNGEIRTSILTYEYTTK